MMIGLCELTQLQELDLSYNNFDGNVPQCFNMLSSLKLFDISSNQFTGILPPSLFVNLTSLEYIDLSHNKFESSFSLSLFSNHTKLEFLHLESDNDEFEVETEEPLGWIPTFQLKHLMVPNCNIKLKRSGVPGFLLHQYKLQRLDLSHNSLEGELPQWLLKNNTKLQVLVLRNNSFEGVIDMGYENLILKELDISGNHMTGTISENIQKFIPQMTYLNFSSNALNGVIPNSVSDLSELIVLDLSNNELSGEVPNALFTSLPSLYLIQLSNNKLNGRILSGNISLGRIERIHLDNNSFTGNIENNVTEYMHLSVLDISNNLFTGMIPSWMGNMTGIDMVNVALIMRNNSLEGQFPCGNASFSFLDISHNSLSGRIPSCLNLESMKSLHLGSNGFTGSIPDAFRNLTNVLTLDIRHNNLSGRIPEFLGELSTLRILLLGANNFVGPIPERLCHLNNVSFIDISSNSLTGPIPRCLNNITGPKELAYIKETKFVYRGIYFEYEDITTHLIQPIKQYQLATEDEVQFTTKSNSLTYFGNILNYMSGLDLSCNKLTGRLPEWKAQFATFTEESYKGNPLLCGQPLEKNCTTTQQVSGSPSKEGTEKWYDIDKASFYGSSSSTWFMFMLGFVAVLFINPYWRRRWFEFVEECMYTCYYFLYDFVRKIYRLFHE
ncbi:hypothetical protein SSX86_010202 [Deinandra increscens subsp. villosa]|uniref:Toll-like receptor 3 n=1 Tax=Deinandra increscens subsp. villosa TaxID=3103831 RepID=A0AAP0D749_9ASTR